MKTKVILTAITLSIFVLSSKAQVFNFNSVPGNVSGQTATTIQGIGIGTWPAATATNARLHVSNFYCNQPNGALGSLQFRTDCDTFNRNTWQMYTGTTPANLTEKFRIQTLTPAYAGANAKDVIIETIQNGTMHFGTHAFTWMTILKSSGNTKGYVGIHTEAPVAPLHVFGDGNHVITSGTGWFAGVHLENHASLVWDKDTIGNQYAFMGYPAEHPKDHSFYFALTPKIDGTTPANYIYRIVDIGIPSGANKTPYSGDVEFFHSIYPDSSVGIGLNTLPVGSHRYRAWNRLEINTRAGDPYNVGGVIQPGGSSGLKFNKLKADSTTPLPINPGPGVLAVDTGGNVIYVKGGTGTGFGTCANQSLLSTNGDLQLNGNNLYFAGGPNPPPTLATNNDVGIGWACGTPLKAKLDVNNTNENIAGKFNSGSGAGGAAGVTGILVSAGGAGFTNKGIDVTSIGGTNNYAIYAHAIGGTNNIGIFASVANNTNWAGYFNGNVTIVNGTYVPSDSILKTNIKPIQNPISTIRQLKPKSFYFDTTNTVGLNFSGKKQYGFLAQNVNTVLPELLNTFYAPKDSTLSTPYSNINYNAFISLLTAGMQQQQLSIDSLRNNSGGGGSVAADNGLSVNSGSVELGGSLTKNTTINTNSNSLNFINSANKNMLQINDNTQITANSYNNLGMNFNTYPSTTTGNSDGVIFNSYGNNADHETGITSTVQQQFGPPQYPSTFVGFDAKTFNSVGTNIGFRANSFSGGNFGGNYGFQTNMTAPSLNNYGYWSSITAGQNAYGVFASASSSFGSNFGVYATATGGLSSYAGYFNGDVYVNGGTNSGTGYLVASDQMFKTNIDTISNPLAIVKQLKPKTFYFDTTNGYKVHLSNKKQYGFIAQDVQTVLPELVGNVTKPADRDSAGNKIGDDVTYKNLNYNAFIALLTSAMQKQQTTIDSLTAKYNQLASLINSCCSNTSRTTQAGGLNTGAVEQAATTNIQITTLSDANIVVLNQNQPNPFAEQTIITYNIPQSANAAQLLFYDVNGKQIQNVNITTKGKGQLNVYANDLTNGVYSYTLIVDGKIIDTKKMVKQQ